jgi:hypothetical protein
MSGNFLVHIQSHIQTSAATSKKSYTKFLDPKKTFERDKEKCNIADTLQ